MFTGTPVLGAVLVRLFGFRNSRAVVIVAFALLAAAGAIVVKFIAADPFEYDIKQLRSEGPDAVVARRWRPRMRVRLCSI